MTDFIHRWVKDHDERWSFLLFYVGGAVILSIFTSLFWVVMLMLCHFLLEVWRHALIRVENPVLEALWHVKLDIALILFALVVALYADTVLAALGLGQAARAGQALRGAEMLTRFAIIERGLRIFLLTVDDLARVAHVAMRALGRNGGKAAQKDADMERARKLLHEEEKRIHGPMQGWHRLSKGDWFSLGFGSACLSLILLAPAITGIGIPDTLHAIMSELQPG